MYLVTEETIKLAIKYLKRDIHDDWYCDLQNYYDLHSNIDNIIDSLNTKIRQGRGLFTAEKSILFNIPKGNGGFRYTLELSPIDRHAFHIFGLQLIKILDHVLPFNILSHRNNPDKDTLFKPMLEQWNKFENYTRVCGQGKYIIEIDISNYYDNIDIHKLKELLIDAASDANLSQDTFLHCIYLIKTIISILNKISYDGERGLPQNRDISSFLANIYMRPLDKCLKGVTYFRYMDDIRIIADNRSEANRYMLNVVETLRKFGLSLNSSKTRILEPGTSEHSQFCDEIDLESKKIDTMINSGKKKYVLESFHEIYSKVIKYLDEKRTHERKFRFYSNRLIIFLCAKDIKVSNKVKNELSEKLIGGIDNRPDCADQLCILAQAIGPNKKLQANLIDWATNTNNLTFEWAVYSVIKTLALQNCNSNKLIVFCKKVLRDGNYPDPITGISAVFLNMKAKKDIMRLLSKNNSHFLQRHLLISLASTEPSELKTNKIDRNILPDFKGYHDVLYKTTHSEGFSYIRRPERFTHKILIKELKNYA